MYFKKYQRNKRQVKGPRAREGRTMKTALRGTAGHRFFMLTLMMAWPFLYHPIRRKKLYDEYTLLRQCIPIEVVGEQSINYK